MRRVRSLIVGIACMFGYIGILVATAAPASAAASGAVGSWSTNAVDLPQALQDEAVVTNNGFIYVVGGQDSGGAPQAAVYYAKLNADGSIGSWTTSPHALPQPESLETAVAYNNYLYVMGGYSSNNTSTVYYAQLNADGSVGAWTASPHSLPQGLSNATSVVHNGYVYVMAGTNGASYLDTVYYAQLSAADGSVGAWSTNSHSLPVAMVLPSSIVHNGYVYVIGGYDGANSLDTVYYAQLNSDGSTGTWATNSTTLTQGVYGAGTVLYDGYVFELGGYHNSSIIGDVYSAPINADNSVGSWTASSNSLPHPLTYAGSATYNGYAYLLGGGYTGTYSTIYYAAVTGLPKPGVANKTVSVTVSGKVVVDVTTGVSGNPDPASIQIISGPSHGTAVDPPATITYTPNKGYTGTDSLTYQLCSLTDESVCAQATLSFVVASSTTSPDTGFGAPGGRPWVALGMAAAAVVLVSAGAAMRYRQRAGRR